MIRVTIVSVSYNSSAALAEMLPNCPNDTKIIVVDNGSRDIETTRALAAEHDAKLIELGENLGFGSACNAGAEGAETEYLLFLNPDAKLKKGGLEALLDGADRHAAASAFNPAFLDKHGTPRFPFSSVLLPGKGKLANDRATEDKELKVLSGAALLVRREAFEAVDGFDTEIFLYHEDDDLSLRLAKKCGPLMGIAAAHLSHDQGNSTPRSAEVAAIKAWHMGRSRVYAMRKHGVKFPFLRSVALALFQTASPLTVLSGRKRAKHINFLRGVLSQATPSKDNATVI